MRVAMIGTRGVPARYGGFETAVEEIGSRLVCAGHEVVVYCRGDDRSNEYLGMTRIRIPALRHPVAETLSHTALSVFHLIRSGCDVALMFNAANAPLLPLVRAMRIPVAVHVDGLEWKRGKWGPVGRRYYLANERLSVLLADELISDAVGIQKYYWDRYRAQSAFISYGAPIQVGSDSGRLQELGLKSGEYHLVVARVEPENHVDVIIRGYSESSAEKPLVIVGSVPYPSKYEHEVQSSARSDSRIKLLGSIWDQGLPDVWGGGRGRRTGVRAGCGPADLRRSGDGLLGQASLVLSTAVCEQRTWTEHHAAIRPRANLTKRTGGCAFGQVAAVTRGLPGRDRAGVVWCGGTVMRQSSTTAPRRSRTPPGSPSLTTLVAAVGVDETAYLRATATRAMTFAATQHVPAVP